MSTATTITGSLVRGNTVHVEAVFLDRYGQPATPPSVTASFNYTLPGLSSETREYAMQFDLLKEVWFYDWDSSVAAPGQVQWSVFTDHTIKPAWADEGYFTLASNVANADGLL